MELFKYSSTLGVHFKFSGDFLIYNKYFISSGLLYKTFLGKPLAQSVVNIIVKVDKCQ